MNAVQLLRLRSRRTLAVAATLVVTLLAAYLINASRADAVVGPSCKATAVIYGPNTSPTENVVANPNYTPCLTDFDADVVGIVEPGLVLAGTREAETTRAFFGAFNNARASWANLYVALGSLVIRVDVLEARANRFFGCRGSSEVAGLTIAGLGGFNLPPVLKLPVITVPVTLALPNGVVLRLNSRQRVGNELIQRAFWLHTPNRDTIAGEAKVGGPGC